MNSREEWKYAERVLTSDTVNHKIQSISQRISEVKIPERKNHNKRKGMKALLDGMLLNSVHSWFPEDESY